MSKMSQAALREAAQTCANSIRAAVSGKEYFAEPYQHVVIDNLFDRETADTCLNNFPRIDDHSWEFANDGDVEIKYRSNWESEFDIPDGIDDVVRILNCSYVLRAISDRLNIPKLVPDPYFSGGGLNVTMRGGLLDVHVDGNYHDATGLNRRVNAIYYLNPNWQPEWGGEFGVYDETGRNCVKTVAPLHNRLVIFDTHDFSFHGLPDPVNFPDDRPRRSVILYYYTKEPRPASQIDVAEPHSALWIKRDLHDKRGNKTRSYS